MESEKKEEMFRTGISLPISVANMIAKLCEKEDRNFSGMLVVMAKHYKSCMEKEELLNGKARKLLDDLIARDLEGFGADYPVFEERPDLNKDEANQ